MPETPVAFLSYVHRDDTYSNGKISLLRDMLIEAYEALTGEELAVFQDRDNIEWGQHWPDALDEAIAGSKFLIPIVTPRFFGSPHCRDELDKFLEQERAARRKDLVLPVYWIDSPLMNDPPAKPADAAGRLASVIHQRQYKDWRTLRLHDFSERLVIEEIEALARAIEKASRRQARAVVPDPVVPDKHAIADFAVFRDLGEPWCPEMVALPKGSFLMGSPKGVGYDNERPQHYVSIGYRLAVGRYPVTFEEYDRFGAATRVPPPTDEGWGRGRRPVINVSWEDAQAYARWLGEVTGQPYRLLSEAEWEYAARAGTTQYDIISEPTNSGEDVGRTTEVGSYPSNAWGLNDMHGNVWEWVEDCWNASYQGAPADGSVWATGDCCRRVLRGFSWIDILAENLRSAVRLRNNPEVRTKVIGFRVARTLTP
jgi:formylglycine-generating enzyme required for sulfatase activity